MGSQPVGSQSAPTAATTTLGASDIGTAAGGSATSAGGTHRRDDAALVPLMLTYGAASLLHFLHNAVYLHAYPNLPAWLTSGGVLGAWLVVAGTGIVGYLLYSRVSRLAGLIVIAAYALFGLGGLDHYSVAPVSAHTVAMNGTILLEVAAAVVLLAYVVRCALLASAQRAKLRG